MKRRKLSAKRLAQMRAWKRRNRDKVLAGLRRWRERNVERRREYMARWRARQPRFYYKRWASWKPKTGKGRWPTPGRTYEQQLEAHKLARRRRCAELSDSYLRGWMSRTAKYTIAPSEWPADLVELKRAQMKVLRLCRESRRTRN